MKIAYYSLQNNYLCVRYQDGLLWGLDITPNKKESIYDAFSDRVYQEVKEYFKGERQSFTIPYQISGTPFQQDVLKALAKIPYGKTVSYGELAVLSGHPHSQRAVGSALKRNPLWLIVPCHRVIQASGKIGYYAGGEDMKRFLLLLEKDNVV